MTLKISKLAIWSLIFLVFISTMATPVYALPAEYELAYDDGSMDGLGGLSDPLGHAVKFTPPSSPWYITKVKVYGKYVGGVGEFSIQIWSEDLTTLKQIGPYQYSDYFSGGGGWVEFDAESVAVDGDFYVCFFANTWPDHGVMMAYDQTSPAGRSYIVSYSKEVMTTFDETNVTARFNYMIRTIGKPVPTQISCSLSSEKITVGGTVTISGAISPAVKGATVTLSFTKPDGSTFTQTTTTNTNGEYNVTLEPEDVGSWSVKASWPGNEDYIGATSNVVSFTVEKKACIIATATFGSELTPEVQFLREFRENIVLSTFAGRQFMIVFNAFYYSFSPSVAEFIANHPVVREITKILIYPLIGILHLSTVTYSVFAFNPEIGVVAAGFVASALIGLVYFTPLAIPILTIIRRYRRVSFKLKWLQIPWIMVVVLMLVGEVSASPVIMSLATATFVIIAVFTAAMIPALKISQKLA